MSSPVKDTQVASEPRVEMPSAPVSDPFQWEKFDHLFDQVFTPNKPASRLTGQPAGYISHQRSSSGPGGFAVDGKIVEDNRAYSDSEDFSKAWEEALKRTKKSTVTTTKRRIIKHTPAAVAPPMPAVSPRPVYARERPLFAHLREGSFQSDSSVLSQQSSASPSEASSISSRSPSPQLRRERSQFDLHESADPAIVTATFEMPAGLSKDQIQVSYSTLYSAEKLTVSWKSVTVTELVEEGRLVRERKERTYTRTLPLPIGTKVCMFCSPHCSTSSLRTLL
ncbi:hypothetical protein FRC02_011270 [Tulasnella sp. 418]|nr:hypothetical protein FRC02_011270 [Tulasnella sp. 418]